MINPIEIRVYKKGDGTAPYYRWLKSLRDSKAIHIVSTRVDRLVTGNLGDCKFVGGGVFELRIHYGPGYRHYIGQEWSVAVILLCGGDKKTQAKDVELAKQYWTDYQDQKRKI